jgi:hypothetical protein
MNATVIETRTATGAATSTGIRSASRGTATNASPNPKAERMIVARNRTAGVRIAAGSEITLFKLISDWPGKRRLGVSVSRSVRLSA